MRTIIFLVIALFIGVGAAVYIHNWLVTQGDPGYVIIGYGQWALESSLFVMGLTLVVSFILFYLLIRIVSRALLLPKALKRRGGELRSRRSQQALVTGLIESAEGHWEKAEKNLIRHAADSGVPLINYLTAARVAHFRGAVEQRDEYLKLARDTTPEAQVAVGLTQAELQLSNRQFEQALASLTELDKIAPSHAAVLKLMHQVYAQMEDWEGLRRLIPALHKNKVMMEAEIKLLETETYSALLKQCSEARDATALKQLWSNMPGHIRSVPGVQSLYFAAMIEAGAGAEIEEAVRGALAKDWNDTNLVLYGCIQSADPAKQLEHAEAWTEKHPADALLFRLLGKLASRLGLWDKAREYLQRSLSLEPSVEAYQLMGDLLMRQNQADKACDFYRNGLLLASHEVVAQIEQNPAGLSVQGEPEAMTAQA